MDEGNEGSEDSEEEETVSPPSSETPIEPSREGASTLLVGTDSTVPTSAVLPTASEPGLVGTGPSAEPSPPAQGAEPKRPKAGPPRPASKPKPASKPRPTPQLVSPELGESAEPEQEAAQPKPKPKPKPKPRARTKPKPEPPAEPPEAAELTAEPSEPADSQSREPRASSEVEPLEASELGEALETQPVAASAEVVAPLDTPESSQTDELREPAQSPAPRRRKGVFALLSAGVIVVVLATVLVLRSAEPHQHASTSTSVPTSIATSTSTTTSTSLAVDTTNQIVRLLDPAVVDINTINQTDTGYAIAAATGMIVSSNGYIVTNNHVVEEATSIKVAIDGHASQYTATFVGANPAADVAVIKVVGLAGLPTVHFGNSSTISVGDQVVALGNAHGRGGPPAVTTGTIAALGRSISASSDITGTSENLTGMIETNAKIVAGNSGGPLIDGQSEVIGMNTAADPGGTFGFALPINRVSTIATAIEQGRAGGGIVLGLGAFLGVVGQRPKSGTKPDGVDITRIVLGDPAAAGGVEPGDVIVDFDGTPTPTVSVLQRLVLALRPGDVATVTFDSPNGLATSSVTLIAGPAP
jgi:S1-C subfamily serine protease